MSDSVDLLDGVLAKTATLMSTVTPEVARRPTPCPGYDVESLVEHLAEWLTTFATSAAGEPPPVTGSATERFRIAAHHAVQAFQGGAEERQLTLMSGPIPGSMVLGMMLMEYLVHGWDLAKGLGAPIPFDDAEAEAALATGRQMLSPEYRGPDKSFGPEVPVPDDASAVDRLVGFAGRDPRWTAT